MPAILAILRGVSKYLDFRTARDGRVGLPIHLRCDSFVEIILTAIPTNVSGYVSHDHDGGSSL